LLTPSAHITYEIMDYISSCIGCDDSYFTEGDLTVNIEEILLDIQKQTAEVNTTVKVLENSFKTVSDKVDTHEQLLMGNPKEMGAGGLVYCVGKLDNAVVGMGKRVDGIRSLFAPLWTGIVAFVSIIVTGLVNYLIQMKKGGH
jgi:hypothetical protein